MPPQPHSTNAPAIVIVRDTTVVILRILPFDSVLIVGSWLRIWMEMSSKFDIERFDGKMSFAL